MAPIPVYSASPINPAKPSGVTPKTAPPGDAGEAGQRPPEISEAVNSHASYPAAQPCSTPLLPRQTAAPQANNVLPTPTQSSSVLTGNPPLPQPGAVPVPPAYSASSALPPPPKAGESARSQQAAAPVTAMPPQMVYQPTQASLPTQGRSSTSTAAPPITGAAAVEPTPTFLQGQYPPASYSPPAGGYQQDVNAAGYNQYQRSTAAYEDQSEASVWDTAKKWAASAGDSIAAAENEVWKRINKD
ncbi:hypothetical protein C2857_006474 [Epichloe festucae Fl1]|uniref:Uncharacterized protein n=1 Tax=Epichloe festucae (strain Fl1) TaxID=877507 RepID=A0A7S9KTW6_EPIFF|nr:hypothetical protein C2857_006474 [Epichloe festucae Fl1]